MNRSRLLLHQSMEGPLEKRLHLDIRLCTFIGVPENTRMCKSLAMIYICNHVNRNNLLQRDTCRVNLDDGLCRLIQVDEGEISYPRLSREVDRLFK
jgi:hypothetical protein